MSLKKWVPKRDPKWALNKIMGTQMGPKMGPWAWDMPNLDMGRAQPGMGHTQCPWSMDMPNQIGPERPRVQQMGPNGPGSKQ